MPRLALRKRHGDGYCILGMVPSSKPRPDSRLTAATSVAEAQLLLGAIARHAGHCSGNPGCSCGARSSRRKKRPGRQRRPGYPGCGEQQGPWQEGRWISPPAIVAACGVAAGSSTSHRAQVAESSGLGLAWRGLASPVAVEGLAGAPASDAACAPTAAEEQGWRAVGRVGGARPAYIPVPLPPDVETVQLTRHRQGARAGEGTARVRRDAPTLTLALA